MPNTKFDAKSFNAEAFKYKVGTVPNLKMNEIKKSAALAANPDIKSVFANQDGTGYARIAMRGLLDGDAVNYDGQTDITATSLKTFEQGVVVVGRAKAWVERDFSYDNSAYIPDRKPYFVGVFSLYCRYRKYQAQQQHQKHNAWRG